jgi:hypothetical protein
MDRRVELHPTEAEMTRPWSRAPTRTAASRLVASAAADSVDGGGEPTQPARYVLDRVDMLAVNSEGIAPGFDLDGMVSTAKSADGCGFPDVRNRWGEPGVDNQFAKVLNLLPPQVGSILPGALDTALAAGGMTMIVEPGYDTDGRVVEVRILRGSGVPLLGTDGRILPSQSFALDDDPLLGTAAIAPTAGDTWTSEPFLLRFRMLFISTDVAFDLQQARLRLVRGEDGELHGDVGGVVSLEHVLKLAGLIGGDDEGLSEQIATLAPALADASLSAQGACDALTMGFRVHGVPAYLLPQGGKDPAAP